MKKRYINELIDSSRGAVLRSGEVLLPDADRVKAANRVNLLALGDVGGTVLMGLRLLGGEAVGQIGIYDLDPAMMRRYEMEINQICFPDGRTLPEVRMLEQDELFDCDMFVFCASKGVPPVGAAGDVRMAQLEANIQLVGIYADMAVKAGFGGIFAVVSDPVDPLCKAAVLSGLARAGAGIRARRDERESFVFCSKGSEVFAVSARRESLRASWGRSRDRRQHLGLR